MTGALFYHRRDPYYAPHPPAPPHTGPWQAHLYTLEDDEYRRSYYVSDDYYDYDDYDHARHHNHYATPS